MREAPRTPPEVANVLRRLLREQGVSETRMSLALDRGKSWLSDLLSGRYPLTFEVTQWIVERLGTSLESVFREAYPQETPKSPEVALHSLAPREPTKPIPNHAKRVKELVEYSPAVSHLEDFDGSVLSQLVDRVWEDRKGAFDYAMFHIDGLLKPRKLHTFAGALGTLSELLRATRSYDNYFRARVLLRAYEILERFPQPEVRAFLDEKAAYLCWNLVPNNPQMISGFLERETLVDHPFTDRLFAARASFQLLSKQPRRALTYSEIVFAMAGSQYSQASAFSTAAQAYLLLGDLDSAISHVDEGLRLGALPSVILLNLRAQKGAILLHRGEMDAAQSLLCSVLSDSYYCRVWPDKAAYAALDLLKSSPSDGLRESLRSQFEIILSELNPANAVEAASIRDLSALIASTADAAHITRNVDLNG